MSDSAIPPEDCNRALSDCQDGHRVANLDEMYKWLTLNFPKLPIFDRGMVDGHLADLLANFIIAGCQMWDPWQLDAVWALYGQVCLDNLEHAKTSAENAQTTRMDGKFYRNHLAGSLMHRAKGLSAMVRCAATRGVAELEMPCWDKPRSLVDVARQAVDDMRKVLSLRAEKYREPDCSENKQKPYQAALRNYADALEVLKSVSQDIQDLDDMDAEISVCRSYADTLEMDGMVKPICPCDALSDISTDDDACSICSTKTCDGYDGEGDSPVALSDSQNIDDALHQLQMVAAETLEAPNNWHWADAEDDPAATSDLRVFWCQYSKIKAKKEGNEIPKNEISMENARSAQREERQGRSEDMPRLGHYTVLDLQSCCEKLSNGAPNNTSWESAVCFSCNCPSSESEPQLAKELAFLATHDTTSNFFMKGEKYKTAVQGCFVIGETCLELWQNHWKKTKWTVEPVWIGQLSSSFNMMCESEPLVYEELQGEVRNTLKSSQGDGNLRATGTPCESMVFAIAARAL